jgi:hypothetical protein
MYRRGKRRSCTSSLNTVTGLKQQANHAGSIPSTTTHNAVPLGPVGSPSEHAQHRTPLRIQGRYFRFEISVEASGCGSESNGRPGPLTALCPSDLAGVIIGEIENSHGDVGLEKATLSFVCQ